MDELNLEKVEKAHDDIQAAWESISPSFPPTI